MGERGRVSSLADVILGNPDDTARVPQLRQGIVTAISPLSVLVGAATSSQLCRTLASYVPTVGDAVSVLVISGDRLVLGRANQTGGTGGGPPIDTTQFVKKTGDEMSGGLTIRSTLWVDGVATVGQLNNGGDTWGGRFMFWNTGVGWSYTAGDNYIRAATSLHLDGAIDTAYAFTYGWNGQASYPLDINGTARITGTLNLGNGLNVSGNDTNTWNINTALNYRVISSGTWGGGWGDSSFLAQNGTNEQRSSITYHTRGIYVVGIGITTGGGLAVWNNGSGGYEAIMASAFNVGSSRKFKQDVRPWPARSAGAAVMGAASRLALIDVVQYRLDRDQALTDPTDDGSPAPHDCATSPCEGTELEPCVRVRDWLNPHLGIIIEDLATVLPEAVALTPDGGFDGMRLGSMVGYLLAVCKEQQERLEELERRYEEAA